MLGERSDQRGLWEADRLYLDHVGRESFYGLLASMRGRLFRDADFAEFYCADNGRDSVPPSLLAAALLLQSHSPPSTALTPSIRVHRWIRAKLKGKGQLTRLSTSFQHPARTRLRSQICPNLESWKTHPPIRACSRCVAQYRTPLRTFPHLVPFCEVVA